MNREERRSLKNLSAQFESRLPRKKVEALEAKVQMIGTGALTMEEAVAYDALIRRTGNAIRKKMKREPTEADWSDRTMAQWIFDPVRRVPLESPTQ